MIIVDKLLRSLQGVPSQLQHKQELIYEKKILVCNIFMKNFNIDGLFVEQPHKF